MRIDFIVLQARRTTDQENFQNVDRGGPRTSEIKKSWSASYEYKGKIEISPWIPELGTIYRFRIQISGKE